METDGQSASCVLAENLFAATRRQAAPEAITSAGIFGKPKLARLFSSRREVAAPAFDADYLWTPCEDPGDDTPYCEQVPINPATQYAAGDGIVMDEVLRSVREGVSADGATKRPNLTFVNLPQIDSAGHASGTGPAYDTAIAQADGELERFVTQQRELGLWQRTVMFVVSDHSMDSTGTKTSLAQRFRAAGIPDSAYLIVQNGSVDMVYLADRAAADAPQTLAKLRAAALAPTLPGMGRRRSTRRSTAPRTRLTAGSSTRSAPCIRAGGSPASAAATCSSPTPRAARSPTRRTRCPATTAGR